MYLSYYVLNEKPFQLTADPNFFWLGGNYKKCLTHLGESLRHSNGIFALTGDVGVGKSILARTFVETCGNDIISAMVSYPSLETETLDFFNLILSAFKIKKTFHTKEACVLSLKRFLKTAYKYNKKVLLALDEAQCIGADIVENIRYLSEIKENGAKLISILFVGQDKTNKILTEAKILKKKNGISIANNIGPLNLKETEAYIKHRLNIAGAKKNIFNSEAIKEIYSFSNGYPLQINIICDLALMKGYSKKTKTIESSIIKECVIYRKN